MDWHKQQHAHCIDPYDWTPQDKWLPRKMCTLSAETHRNKWGERVALGGVLLNGNPKISKEPAIQKMFRDLILTGDNEHMKPNRHIKTHAEWVRESDL